MLCFNKNGCEKNAISKIIFSFALPTVGLFLATSESAIDFAHLFPENDNEATMWSSRSFIFVVLFLGTILETIAFLPSQGAMSGSRIISSSGPTHSRASGILQMSDRNEDGENRLRDLGFSDDEIARSRREPPKEERKVRVDMVDNVDATSLTALGFAAIAFNFFVLANMGDGGIGGLVATIINSF